MFHLSVKTVELFNKKFTKKTSVQIDLLKKKSIKI